MFFVKLILLKLTLFYKEIIKGFLFKTKNAPVYTEASLS